MDLPRLFPMSSCFSSIFPNKIQALGESYRFLIILRSHKCFLCNICSHLIPICCLNVPILFLYFPILFLHLPRKHSSESYHLKPNNGPRRIFQDSSRKVRTSFLDISRKRARSFPDFSRNLCLVPEITRKRPS